MSVASALSSGRRAANSLMTSTCTITDPSTASGRDAAGFRNAGGATVYSGQCEVADGGVRVLNVGGTQTEQATKTLKLPAPAPSAVKDGCVAHIDTGDAAGVNLRLLEVTPSDHKTAARIPCVEV